MLLSYAPLHCCHSLSSMTACETNCFPLHIAYFPIKALNKFHSAFKPPTIEFQSHGRGRVAFPIFALKNRGNRGIDDVSELSDSGDEFDGFLDEDGGDYRDGSDDAEDEGMLLPLAKMKEWLKRRPRGFGEGREYDTSIEDKLLDEMEQSRVAQAANLNKLKNESVMANSNKKVGKIEAPESVDTGVCIRISNLPKKKNIHRDLMMSFKEFPGITKITPAVAGNKKTRDPVCKGFAFVDFKSEGDAIRFMQLVSRQLLTFGKIQKQIKCEIVRRPASSSHESFVGKMNVAPQLTIHEEEDQQVNDSDMNDCSELQEETPFDKSTDLVNEIVRTPVVIEESAASTSELHSDGDGAESRIKSKIQLRSLEELEKIQELVKAHSLKKELLSKEREEVPKEVPPVKGKKLSKKKNTEEKGGKKLSIEVPGSAKSRLRVKEKAVLADVYSRYGIK